MKKTRRLYTAEFKAQAVELLQAGRPAAELGIGQDLKHAFTGDFFTSTAPNSGARMAGKGVAVPGANWSIR